MSNKRCRVEGSRLFAPVTAEARFHIMEETVNAVTAIVRSSDRYRANPKTFNLSRHCGVCFKVTGSRKSRKVWVHIEATHNNKDYKHVVELDCCLFVEKNLGSSNKHHQDQVDKEIRLFVELEISSSCIKAEIELAPISIPAEQQPLVITRTATAGA